MEMSNGKISLTGRVRCTIDSTCAIGSVCWKFSDLPWESYQLLMRVACVVVESTRLAMVTPNTSYARRIVGVIAPCFESKKIALECVGHVVMSQRTTLHNHHLVLPTLQQVRQLLHSHLLAPLPQNSRLLYLPPPQLNCQSPRHRHHHNHHLTQRQRQQPKPQQLYPQQQPQILL
jgi:hypothetical protein